MNVPLLDLKAQWAPLREEILAAITGICDEQQFIMGPAVGALEQDLAAYLDCGETVAVSSGTDALLVALQALGVGCGDEVVTSAYSFFATAGAIARLGATPVFVDIDPGTFNLMPEQAGAAITSRTRAIMPVHLFGQAADMETLARIAGAANLPVVEDAAQALGGRAGGRAVGTLGVMGCFSFFPSKNLGAFGDAGLVAVADSVLAARVRRLRNHGSQPKYVHHEIGGNFRMDTIQAAVLRIKLRHLDGWSEARRRNAARYRDLFEEQGLRDAVGLPAEAAGRHHVYNQFVIRVAERDALRQHLDACGIGTEVYYPLPLPFQPCFASRGFRRGQFPEAERAAATCLALPVFPEVTVDQQRHVVASIKTFLDGSSRGPSLA